MSYQFDGTAIFAIYSAWEIASTVGFPLVPKESLFTVLCGMPSTPVYNYFISKGIKDEEIEEKRVQLLNEMFRGQKEYHAIPFTLETDDKDTPDTLLVDSDILRILNKAMEIAEKEYASKSIGITHITAAFSELYPDEFMHIMKTYIPTIGIPNTLNELGGDVMLDFELPRELCSFLTVLNDKYSADSKECHICGRDEETKSLIRILMKRTKRNAVLVGFAGVGKTALVEKFTWQIVTGNCPEQFKDSIVLSLDVNAIVAGTQYRGTAEERFRQLIQFLERNPRCILFVDEIHLLLGAGACRDGDLDLANALKPMLARGETRVIGATTEDEYKKYFSRDSALKRRFEPIEVREPRADEVYDMIKNQIKLLEETHHTTISRELVDSVIFKAACFNFETKNPDRTLDLLDKTMVCAELEGRTVVTEQDILENFKVNQKKFDKMSEKNKYATAYHEAGHYIAHRFSDELIEHVLLAVSIMPAEEYLGVNVFEIDPDMTPSNNRDYYIQTIACSLAGRVAERMYSKALTSGAVSDLAKATRVAKAMVTQYGLVEDMSQDRVFIRDGQENLFSEQMVTDINVHMNEILKEARDYTEKLLKEKKVYLDVLAKALVERGMLSNNEIDELFKKVKLSK